MWLPENFHYFYVVSIFVLGIMYFTHFVISSSKTLVNIKRLWGNACACVCACVHVCARACMCVHLCPCLCVCMCVWQLACRSEIDIGSLSLSLFMVVSDSGFRLTLSTG